MKLLLKAGTVSQLARVFIRDATKSDGSGLTGLTHGSVGLKWNYARQDQAAATAVALAAAAVGTWTSGGFTEFDAVKLPGVYEIGIPDDALASVGSVQMLLFGAPDMAPCPVEIELTLVPVGTYAPRII